MRGAKASGSPGRGMETNHAAASPIPSPPLLSPEIPDKIVVSLCISQPFSR